MAFYLKAIMGGFLLLIIMLGAILWAAGTDYWQGELFVLIIFLLYIISMIFFRGKMDMLKERLKPGPGMKWWDKIFYAVYAPMFLAVFIIGILDGGVYNWTGELPLTVYLISFPVFTFAVVLQQWAKLVNSFFSSVVRIQKDRRQATIQTGPYAIVRHPGYVAGILMALSSGPALGSLWAMVPGVIVIIALIVRTHLEDKTLQIELSGYRAYAKKVKYRLLPGVW